MKILYITSLGEDYLQDQVLIGLRSLFGSDVVDYPKKDVLYNTCSKASEELYGRGFTVWKTLPDIEIDRSEIWRRFCSGEFDLIVFGSIWRRIGIFFFSFFQKILSRVQTRFIFLDGEDQSVLFIPACLCGVYYKRELVRKPFFNSVKPINFSIPSIKIRQDMAPKDRLFAKHVQCEEVYKIEEVRANCQKSYGFSDEALYYDDIARSKYAVTMKKAGWDCMRHYEIAANGTVPCFYELDKKTRTCAPHGLVDMENVVMFRTADELMEKITHIDNSGAYLRLQQNVLRWAQKNSCENIAKKILNETRIYKGQMC